MNNKRIAFLFGSGISVAAGMPSTDEITKEMLSTEGFRATKRRITDKNDSGIERIIKQPFENDILNFLIKLYEFAEKHNTHKYWRHFDFQCNRNCVNYEDLFFLLIQIHDDLNCNYNPYGNILIDCLEFNQLMEKWVPYAVSQYQSKENQFISDVILYIILSVMRMLNERDNATIIDRSKIITEMFNYCMNQPVDIFTLNHDLLLEQMMGNKGLSFIDGFGNADGDLRKWSPDVFDNNDIGVVRLFKLHGSLDWQIFEIENSNKRVLAKYIGPHDINNEIVPIEDSQGIKYIELGQIEILVGTENKVREYWHMHFWDLHYRFRKLLNQKDCLIVSGYGFGDSAINGQILEWLLNEDDKRLVVIDVKDRYDFIEELKYDFRFDKRWEYLEKVGKAVYLKKGIEEASFDDISDSLK